MPRAFFIPPSTELAKPITLSVIQPTIPEIPFHNPFTMFFPIESILEGIDFTVLTIALATVFIALETATLAVLMTLENPVIAVLPISLNKVGKFLIALWIELYTFFPALATVDTIPLIPFANNFIIFFPRPSQLKACTTSTIALTICGILETRVGIACIIPIPSCPSNCTPFASIVGKLSLITLANVEIITGTFSISVGNACVIPETRLLRISNPFWINTGANSVSLFPIPCINSKNFASASGNP